jgi:hypothetical protein
MQLTTPRIYLLFVTSKYTVPLHLLNTEIHYCLTLNQYKAAVFIAMYMKTLVKLKFNHSQEITNILHHEYKLFEPFITHS